jgi:hypothetical protein
MSEIRVWPIHWKNDRDYFFKYVTFNTAQKILENRTLRWSTPGTLNDPYDVQFDLQIEINRKAVTVIALEKLWKNFYEGGPADSRNKFGAIIKEIRGIFPRLSQDEFNREYGEAIEESLALMERRLPQLHPEVRIYMAKSKILCLTESPDNMIMWAHYAEQNQGVVLRFKSITEFDSAWGMARPINYLANMPRLFDTEFLADLLAGNVSMDTETILNRLIYTKSDHWSYEKEWRVYSGAGRDVSAIYEDLQFHDRELDGVIIGCRMREENVTSLVNFVKKIYPHAEILKAVPSQKEFRFDIRPFEE